MFYYKITKSYKGGMSIYFAKSKTKIDIESDEFRDYQLPEWGESTDGGHCYGYTIKCEEVKNKPKEAIKELKFNMYI